MSCKHCSDNKINTGYKHALWYAANPSSDWIIWSQTAGARVDISYVTGNSLENDSIYKTQESCLDREEVKMWQTLYTEGWEGGAAARRSVHLCFRRFQRWLTCFKVFFCAVFTLFFLLIKLYLLEPLERPHRLQESNFPSQLHAAAASFRAFIVNFIWKQRTMDFCSLLLIFKDSVTSNHLLPTRVLPMTKLVARPLCRESTSSISDCSWSCSVTREGAWSV